MAKKDIASVGIRDICTVCGWESVRRALEREFGGYEIHIPQSCSIEEMNDFRNSKKLKPFYPMSDLVSDMSEMYVSCNMIYGVAGRHLLINEDGPYMKITMKADCYARVCFQLQLNGPFVEEFLKGYGADPKSNASKYSGELKHGKVLCDYRCSGIERVYVLLVSWETPVIEDDEARELATEILEEFKNEVKRVIDTLKLYNPIVEDNE